MKKIIWGLLVLSSVSVFASSIQERALSVDGWCFKDKKINLGVFKLDQGCKVELAEKDPYGIEGICRGSTVLKNNVKVNYKISFSTKPENSNLSFVALTKESLWNEDKNLNPEMNFYQPTWNEHRNQKILIFNKEKSTTVMRGHETVVKIKSDYVDLLLIEGDMGISNKTYSASIIVKNFDGEHELDNASCDLML